MEQNILQSFDQEMSPANVANNIAHKKMEKRGSKQAQTANHLRNALARVETILRGESLMKASFWSKLHDMSGLERAVFANHSPVDPAR